MRRLTFLFVLALAVLAPSALAQLSAVEKAPAPAAEAETVTKYVCPMKDYLSDKAGKCPVCGMELVEKQMTPAAAAKLEEEIKGQPKA